MKIKYLFLILLFSCPAFQAFSNTTETDPKNNEDKNELTEKEFRLALDKLATRINHLKEAKKNATSKEERKEIKNEIKEVKKLTRELKTQAVSNGIYIGSGALIVILLLILLL